MPSIQKMFAADFDLILPLMQAFDNPLLTETDWRALFTHHWPVPYDHFGYAIMENGVAVGFLGTVFSQRQIRGRLHPFCNLSTWYVKPAYRGMSLMLLFEVLKLKDCTITNFTANRVTPILKKTGFCALSEKLKMFLPVPVPAAVFSKLKVTTDPHGITARLSGEALAVYQDHAPLKCQHLLVEDGSEQCYIVYDTVKKKRLPVARLHHISNPVFFASRAHQFALPACRKMGLFGLLAAENLLKGEKARPTFILPQRQALLYRSSTLSAQDIDTLYSELQILGLRT